MGTVDTASAATTPSRWKLWQTELRVALLQGTVAGNARHSGSDRRQRPRDVMLVKSGDPVTFEAISRRGAKVRCGGHAQVHIGTCHRPSLLSRF